MIIEKEYLDEIRNVGFHGASSIIINMEGDYSIAVYTGWEHLAAISEKNISENKYKIFKARTGAELIRAINDCFYGWLYDVEGIGYNYGNGEIVTELVDFWDEVEELTDISCVESIELHVYNAPRPDEPYYGDEHHVIRGSVIFDMKNKEYTAEYSDKELINTFYEERTVPVADGDFLVDGNKLVKYVGSERRVVIPDYIIKIGSAAFEGNEIIEEVVFPESVRLIDWCAFYRCVNLKKIVAFGDHCSISWRAFGKCRNLENIRSLLEISYIDFRAFEGCDKLADENGFFMVGSVLHYYAGKKKELIIPDNCTEIKILAIYKNPYVERITVGKGVYIEYNSIYDCCNLKEVRVDKSEDISDLMLTYKCPVYVNV